MVGIAVSLGFHLSLRFWERGRQITPLDLSPRFEPRPFPGTSLDSLWRRYEVDIWEPPPAAAPEDPLAPPQVPTQESEPATPEQPLPRPDAEPPVVAPDRARLKLLFPPQLEDNDPDTAPSVVPDTEMVPSGVSDDAGLFPLTTPPDEPPVTTTPMLPPELAPAPPLPLPAAPTLSPLRVPTMDPERPALPGNSS